MCGIVGYFGESEASAILFNSLRRLEYRGYDSFGFATLDNGKLWLSKDMGRIGEVAQIKLPGSMGISHTRWSTHGPPTKENAHPHTDCKNQIAVVHNGIITNYLSLKNMLKKRGHIFVSDTDTEVLSHLIEDNYSSGRGVKLEEAVSKALSMVEGAYAIAVMSCLEKKIVGAKNESPLVLGIGNKEFYLGSDISSFLPRTNKTIPIDDFEMVVIDENGFKISDYRTGEYKEKKITEIEWGSEDSSKGGFEHFMLKEIFEQPGVLRTAMGICDSEIQSLAEEMNKAEDIYITATGTSLHAALISEYWFSKLAGVHVRTVDSSEFSEKAVLGGKTLVISITQSGETYDTLRAMRHAREKGCVLASIVNIPCSTATRMSDITILQGSGLETGVAATKTFTTQLMLLLRTVLALAKKRGRDVSALEEELKQVPRMVEECITQKGKIMEIAERYCGEVSNFIYIGRGINYPTALEAALKFKEITYLHAEGMPSGFLKHGTISLISDEMHTIAFVPRDDRKILSSVEEIKSRGGKVLGIVSGTAKHFDDIISVPKSSDIVSPIVFAPAYQMLAYYTSVMLGRDPDKPRHLAKSVTVE